MAQVFRPPAAPARRSSWRAVPGLLSACPHAVLMADRCGIGWDAHAYYVAWSGDLYDHAPGTLDAYNYSPLFAQVIWPLTHLPWPVFCALFIGAAAARIAWLVRPLPLPLAVGMWLFCTPRSSPATSSGCSRCAPSRASPAAALGAWRRSPRSSPASAGLVLAAREWRRLGGFVATSSRCSPPRTRSARRCGTTGGTSSAPTPVAPPSMVSCVHPAAGRPAAAGRRRAGVRRSHRPPLAGAGVHGARQPGGRVGHVRPARRDPAAARPRTGPRRGARTARRHARRSAPETRTLAP